MQSIKQALLDFCRDFLPYRDVAEDKPVETSQTPHDLGHASKCVWELDKEA